jgi:hypothetical protein
MNELVDKYFEDGCGRGSLYKTPAFKVNNWINELQELLKIVVSCGLRKS